MLRAGLFVPMLGVLQVPGVLQRKYGEHSLILSSQVGGQKGLQKSTPGPWPPCTPAAQAGDGCKWGQVMPIGLLRHHGSM